MRLETVRRATCVTLHHKLPLLAGAVGIAACGIIGGEIRWRVKTFETPLQEVRRAPEVAARWGDFTLERSYAGRF